MFFTHFVYKYIFSCFSHTLFTNVCSRVFHTLYLQLYILVFFQTLCLQIYINWFIFNKAQRLQNQLLEEYFSRIPFKLTNTYEYSPSFIIKHTYILTPIHSLSYTHIYIYSKMQAGGAAALPPRFSLKLTFYQLTITMKRKK